MSDRYDVAARLEEGRPAVEHTQAYVRACEALGYQQPDLTAHPSQVGDWYDTEAGLDLRVLDSDVAELRGALTAIEEALWVQRTQVTEIVAAWRGSAADSATRFLQRHCDAGAEVAAQVRAAAEHCATLRDEVWRAVDAKVATTVAIDERHVAERSVWLAAAQAVATGSHEAEAVVRRHVMPYVDNDIRNDWLAAMSSSNASVAASYDTAIHALASMRETSFDIPGELGPRWQPPVDDRPVTDAAPAPSVATSPLPTSPLPTMPAAAPVAAPEVPPPVDAPDDIAATPPDDAGGLSTGAGGLGGLGGATGGIGGVVGSIVDGISSLLGSLAGGLGGTQGLEDGPLDLDDADDPPTDDDVDSPDDAAEPAAAEDVVADPPAVESPTPSGEVIAEPVAQPVASPPPDAEPPAEAAAPETETPCEIAEDQLPQVGQ